MRFKWLWFLLILPITPIIINFIIRTPSKMAVGEPSDWISFFGGYTGAIVGGISGGIVALLVARYQVKQDRIRAEIIEIKNFLKIEMVISKKLSKLLYVMNDAVGKEGNLIGFMLEHLNREADVDYHFKKNKSESERAYKQAMIAMENIKRVREDISKIIKEINNTNDDHIPYEFYSAFSNEYFEMKDSIKDLLDFIDEFIKNDFDAYSNSVVEASENSHRLFLQSKMLSEKDDRYWTIFKSIHGVSKLLDEISDQYKNRLKKLEESQNEFLG